MRNAYRRRRAAILSTGIVVAFGLSAPASWAQNGDDQVPKRACFKTTELMQTACGSDAVDDYFEGKARCLNTQEKQLCHREAFAEFVGKQAECEIEASGRDDLCERLRTAGAYVTDIDPENFKSPEEMQAGGNKFFPLVIGTVWTYRNEEDNEDIVVTVTDRIREIEGVETIVVQDVVSIDGERIEDTDDYYAEDRDGNVWYFGEVAQNFEDGFLTDLDGSFTAGEEGAQAGMIMLANPMVNDVYRQEFALGDAEDAAEVLGLDGDVEIANPDFACAGACLKTLDFVATEPDSAEFKYYKEGLGLVAEEQDGEVVLELVSVESP